MIVGKEFINLHNMFNILKFLKEKLISQTWSVFIFLKNDLIF